MPRIGDLHETEVDGVRTVWTDARRPFTALLMCRVGFFDETLPKHGITHLVEHLALAPLKDTELDFNGHVEGYRTVIHASGHPERVAAFLTDVCRNLSELPTDRLHVEANVLQREARTRASSFIEQIVGAYYGSRGPGLANYGELGLSWLESEQVRGWSREFFTKANTVLALTGPPPDDWRLPMPDGAVPSPIALPERTIPVPESPTLLKTQDAGVSWGALVKVSRDNKQPEVLTSIQVLARRLMDRLRHDLGRVYGVSSTYWRLDREHVFTHIGVDSDAPHSREVAEEFLSVASEFVDSGPTADELERIARDAERQMEDYPDIMARGLVSAHAEALLCDWIPPPSPAEIVSLTRSQESDAVRERFAEAYRQSYYVANLPYRRLAWVIDPEYATPGEGTDFKLRLGYKRRWTPLPNPIRIGPDGISARSADGWLVWPLDDLDAVVISGTKVGVLEPRKVLEFDLSDYRRSQEMERLLRSIVPPHVLLPPPRPS